MRLPTSFGVVLLIPVLYACSDSSGPGGVGPLSAVSVRSGDAQTALAGTVVPLPIIVVPQDASGKTVPGETATFAVTAGGGTISNTTGQVNSDGTITAPAWTLGNSAVPQQLQVTVEGKTMVINATVKTSYQIQISFFGRSLPPDQQALFTNAVARITAAVVGSLPPVNASNNSPTDCGVVGGAPFPNPINGLLIYASIDSIDGPRNILAESFPCFVRLAGGQQDFRTVVGVMKFDSADIGLLTGNGTGNLQEVITHEMLHILGFGTFWDPSDKNLLINDSTPTVAYIGAGGIAGCRAIGGVTTCASSVPVEGKMGGAGTLYSHWDEATFKNELMTGFLNQGVNPLSRMTIQSLGDFGYVVNPAAADPFTIPGGSIRAEGSVAITSPMLGAMSGRWERRVPFVVRGLPIMGLPTFRK
jgi:hypothetical protein